MKYENIYFLGIGGIGMSALARFFMHEGYGVAGYDLTRTALTEKLERQGARIHYDDDVSLIGEQFRNPETTLVVYTPAVPHDNSEMEYFSRGGFTMLKRSQMLGRLTEGKFVMAVAGTHGKTTTTTLTAWLNHVCTGGGSAFLGGISKNFDSNLVLGAGTRMAVEADEFDRSFLRLYPDAAVVTSADADHLDIYGTHEAVKQAFSQFIAQIKAGGALIIKEGVDVKIDNDKITVYRYSVGGSADFRAENIRPTKGGHYRFDIVCPDRTITDCTLGITGEVNIENCVAAVALFLVSSKIRGEEFDEKTLKQALATFSGVRRRFDIYINTERVFFMDDYAHHPREIAATLRSVRDMLPGRKITAVFQPHLYTRTRDLYREFAEALSIADNVVLLPIYPARELPIEGVSSQMIADLLSVPHTMSDRQTLSEDLAAQDTDIVITLGAGNIENCCEAIAKMLENKYGL